MSDTNTFFFFFEKKKQCSSNLNETESAKGVTELESFYHTLDAATYPSKVASTGVLQGEAANANVRPAK